jgi:mRNA-degrading endonuclease toxin of MazEF toxin-antitoxin module
VLIVSIDRMNLQPARRSIVVPLTSTERSAGVPIKLEAAGGAGVNYAGAFQVRTVSHDRLTAKLGTASLEARQVVAKQSTLLTRTPAYTASPCST